jgi:hypothetical protein
MALTQQEQPPIKCGAQRVISQDGPSVVVIMGDRELLMSPKDAIALGQRIVQEGLWAQGVNQAIAGMADAGLSEQTCYRAMHFAIYGKRARLTRKAAE